MKIGQKKLRPTSTRKTHHTLFSLTHQVQATAYSQLATNTVSRTERQQLYYNNWKVFGFFRNTKNQKYGLSMLSDF